MLTPPLPVRVATLGGWRGGYAELPVLLPGVKNHPPLGSSFFPAFKALAETPIYPSFGAVNWGPGKTQRPRVTQVTGVEGGGPGTGFTGGGDEGRGRG